MTAELFIYRGLPGSGKTTRARELQAATGGRLVGRDHLRELLFGGYANGETPDPAREAKVTKLQEQLIREGLREGQKVIVDDMNLRQKYVKRLMKIAREEGALHSFIDLTNVPVDDCVYRDSCRSREVGAAVIRDLHERFIKGKPYPLPLPFVRRTGSQGAVYVPNPDAPAAVIVDLDGTLAHNDGHRGWYEYDKVGADKPKADVIRAVRWYEFAGDHVLFVSGRTDSCYDETRQWLDRHVTRGGKLWMRKTGDYRDDAVVKREIFDEHIRDNYWVVGVYDDRQRVVDMWRSLGLTCFQVAPGDF